MVSLAMNELFDIILVLVFSFAIFGIMGLAVSPDRHVLESGSYGLATTLSLLSDEEGLSANLPLKEDFTLSTEGRKIKLSTEQLLQEDIEKESSYIAKEELSIKIDSSKEVPSLIISS